MRSMAEGIGATIKPISAVFALGSDADWRCPNIPDALKQRQNYFHLCTLPAKRLSLSATVVYGECKVVLRQLVQGGTGRASS